MKNSREFKSECTKLYTIFLMELKRIWFSPFKGLDPKMDLIKRKNKVHYLQWTSGNWYNSHLMSVPRNLICCFHVIKIQSYVSKVGIIFIFREFYPIRILFEKKARWSVFCSWEQDNVALTFHSTFPGLLGVLQKKDGPPSCWILSRGIGGKEGGGTQPDEYPILSGS